MSFSGSRIYIQLGKINLNLAYDWSIRLILTNLLIKSGSALCRMLSSFLLRREQCKTFVQIDDYL